MNVQFSLLKCISTQAHEIGDNYNTPGQSVINVFLIVEFPNAKNEIADSLETLTIIRILLLCSLLQDPL